MNINKETLDHLIIKRSPKFHRCSIEIPEKDLLVENIQFELCKINKNKTKIEGTMSGFKINIFIQYKPQTLGADITFDFKLPEKFPSILNCILFYQVLINYLEGEKLLFYFNNSTSTATAAVHSLNSDILIFRKTLEFFESLRKIEKAFLIKFEGAKAVFSKSNFTLVKSLSDLVDNKYILANFKDGVRIYRNDNKPLKELPDHIESFFIRFDDREFVELYGHKIDLGERGLEIINIEPLILEAEGFSAIAKSRTEQYLQRYSSVYSFDSIKYID